MKKKNDLIIIILFILIGIILIGFVGYRAYNDFFTDKAPSKKLISLDLYGYSLSNNDTAIYKDTFKALEKELNKTPINYSEYAKLLSELFVIDVFTLNNKLTSTDIGGLEFIHKNLRENFKDNLGNNLYKNIESNLDGTRTQALPEVSKVEVVDSSEIKYTYNKEEYDAYLVTINIEYKEDMGYPKSIKITSIKDNNKVFIVKGE